MKKTKQDTIVLKIGGSVVTYKNNTQVRIRKTRLREIAAEIKSAIRKQPHIRLVLVHGAGSAGHQLANKFKLKDGVCGNSKKLRAALAIRENNQLLNIEIVKIFRETGLFVTPFHSGSVVLQTGGALRSLPIQLIELAMDNDCIPLMYGEMVFDTHLGLSICSGDTLATSLAQAFSASTIAYASDIDGIYDVDPYRNAHARLIERATIKELIQSFKVTIGDSHHVDVTGGLANKIDLIANGRNNPDLKRVVIFNGLRQGMFAHVLHSDFSHCSLIDI